MSVIHSSDLCKNSNMSEIVPEWVLCRLGSKDLSVEQWKVGGEGGT